MKVCFSHNMKDLDGNVLTEQPGNPESRAITLRTLAVNSIMAFGDEEKNMTGEEKVKRYDLAFLIHNSKDDLIDLSVEDISLIKKQIGRIYAPLLVGQAWKMLEGE